MILSPYSNPPYRTPTARISSSSPPPPDSSPKRKRSSSSGSLEINTRPQLDGNDLEGAGPNSPRTKVAEKLDGLNLDRQPKKVFRGNHSDAVARKRFKRVKDDGAAKRTPIRAAGVKPGDELFAQLSNEIDETPDCRIKFHPPTLPSPSSDLGDSVGVTVYDHTNAMRRTPPPTTAEGLQPLTPNSGALSPLPKSSSQSPDQGLQYWRDDEITGHELDPGGDDDGEGINGIGFRPTPAMAFARQQRRRQQVNEWKAREARDARQRRIERRKRGRAGGGAMGGQEEEKKVTSERVVRFADAAG